MHNRNLWAISLFAIIMAYLEAAVVVYLRRIYGIENFLASLPPASDINVALQTCARDANVGW